MQNSMNQSKTMLRTFTFFGIIFSCLALSLDKPLSHDFNTESESVGETEFQVPGSGTEEWGLPDVTAVVGKLFQYSLTHPAGLQGGRGPRRFEMTLGDVSRLPGWMIWNEDSNIIEGVPLTESIGTTSVIYVTEIKSLPDGSLQDVQETIFVTVIDNKEQFKLEVNGTMDKKEIQCTEGSAVTKSCVIMDADLKILNPQQRIDLIKMISSYLDLSPTALTLLPNEEGTLWEESALVAGPGDTPDPQNPGVRLEWLVGCGNVEEDQMHVLELLEMSATNGSLSGAVGYGVIGWLITNHRPKSAVNKYKRQAHLHIQPTATLQPSLQPSVRPLFTSYPGNEEYRQPEDLPSSIWLRPQLEIFIKATPYTGSPSRPVDEGRISPTPPLIQPTRPGDYGYTDPSTGIRPTPGYPGHIDPSIEYSRPSHVSPTASLPERETKYPYPDSKYPNTDDPWKYETPEPVKPTDYYSSKPDQPSSRDPWYTPGSATPPPDSKGETFTKGRKTTTTPQPSYTFDSFPELRNNLPKQTAEVGKVFWFQIPTETFYDYEDGFTNHLTLLQLQSEGRTLPRDSWIRLNETSQIVYGHPLEEHIGMYRYDLGAADKKNHLVIGQLEVEVQPTKNADKFTHEFKMILDLDYAKFRSDLDLRVAVLNKMARAFGDKNADKITVTRLAKGSVEMSWTNNSLPHDPCPADSIVDMTKIFLSPDGQVNEGFAGSMRPFKILSGHGTPLGSCSLTPSTPQTIKTETATTPKMTPKQEEPVQGEVAPSGGFLLYVVIAIIVFLVIVLILIVICIVCYKRQRSRRERQEKEEEIGSSKKGIPIIFADELEQSGAGNGGDDATPVSTLKSVKSLKDTDTIDSVPPPEYQKSKPGSASSTLRSDWKAPLLDNDEPGDSRDNTLEKKSVENGSAKENEKNETKTRQPSDL